jgi:hypothetical protein
MEEPGQAREDPREQPRRPTSPDSGSTRKRPPSRPASCAVVNGRRTNQRVSGQETHRATIRSDAKGAAIGTAAKPTPTPTRPSQARPAARRRKAPSVRPTRQDAHIRTQALPAPKAKTAAQTVSPQPGANPMAQQPGIQPQTGAAGSQGCRP